MFCDFGIEIQEMEGAIELLKGFGFSCAYFFGERKKADVKNFKTYAGALLKPTNRKELLASAKKSRNFDFLCIDGNYEDVRFAAEKRLVDVVKYNKVDEIIARACAKNRIYVEFDFSDVLVADFGRRGQIMQRMRRNAETCKKAGARCIVGSCAKSVLQLRAANDLLAFARIIGLANGKEALGGLK